MALTPVSSSTSTAAQSAYGLDFQTLLQIILAELTYQDPLKPVDNFEFVSQLGQFAQLQQSQTLNDTVSQMLAAQGVSQATSLLGKTIDLSTNGTTVSGQVNAVSFTSGQPTVTITTTDGQTVSGISISDISQVR